MSKNWNKTETEEAKTRLREWLKPGDKVYCILRTVSRSGMSRVIDLKAISPEGRILSIGYNAAAAIGYTYDRQREGIKIGGCGMDMGFSLVYSLGYALWPNGFDTPPGYHRNTPLAFDPDGGYALKHEWM